MGEIRDCPRWWQSLCFCVLGSLWGHPFLFHHCWSPTTIPVWEGAALWSFLCSCPAEVVFIADTGFLGKGHRHHLALGSQWSSSLLPGCLSLTTLLLNPGALFQVVWYYFKIQKITVIKLWGTYVWDTAENLGCGRKGDLPWLAARREAAVLAVSASSPGEAIWRLTLQHFLFAKLI